MSFKPEYPAQRSFNVKAVLAELPDLVAKIPDLRTVESFLSAWTLAMLRDQLPPASIDDILDRPSSYRMFLPFGMRVDFPHCSPLQLRQLAICDAYGLVYSGWIDDVIDGLSNHEHGVVGQREADAIMAYEHMIINLQQLFPPHSDFWGYLQCLIQQFSDAMNWETLHRDDCVAQYSYDEFCSLAQGKMSLALINPIALSLLNNTPERLPGLIKAWREISVAMILFDEIADWKTDLEENQFSFLVNQVLTSGKNGPTSDITEIRDSIALSGVIPILFQCTAAHLKEAQRFAGESNAPVLHQLCQDCLDSLDSRSERRGNSIFEITGTN